MKSRVFFSPNVPRLSRVNICRNLRVSEMLNLGRYLVFLILHRGRAVINFNFVIDRVQAKLDGWKSKLLYHAGRLVLLKFVALPIPNYYIQCVALPSKVCNSIDKFYRNFLWGSTPEKKKLHIVNWHKVTLPKEIGASTFFT